MVARTGIEPVISGLKGQRPKPLDHRAIYTFFPKAKGFWWAHLDSNQGPISYEPTALTAELWARAPLAPLIYHLGPNNAIPF